MIRLTVSMVVLTLLSSVTVSASKAEGEKSYLAGGPFIISKDDIIGCGDDESAIIVNEPKEHGRATIHNAFSQGRCQDYYKGTIILIARVTENLMYIVSDNGSAGSFRWVPSNAVENMKGGSILSMPEVYQPRITFQAATYKGPKRTVLKN